MGSTFSITISSSPTLTPTGRPAEPQAALPCSPPGGMCSWAGWAAPAGETRAAPVPEAGSCGSGSDPTCGLLGSLFTELLGGQSAGCPVS